MIHIARKARVVGDERFRSRISARPRHTMQLILFSGCRGYCVQNAGCIQRRTEQEGVEAQLVLKAKRACMVRKVAGMSASKARATAPETRTPPYPREYKW
jgi:hypothetical protein